MILTQGLIKVLESGIVNYLYIVMKKMCAKCGGSMKKYQKGGSSKSSEIKYLPSKAAYDKSIRDMGGPDNPPVQLSPREIYNAKMEQKKRSVVNKMYPTTGIPKKGTGAKKYAKGGSTMKTTVGKATPKGQIYGIPQTGPTGPNIQGIDTMKKGGAIKKKYAKGGSSFGMLSVKAGIDKNPKPTAADRIAGAKMQNGGKVTTTVTRAKASDPYPMAMKQHKEKLDQIKNKYSSQMYDPKKTLQTKKKALDLSKGAYKKGGSIKKK